MEYNIFIIYTTLIISSIAGSTSTLMLQKAYNFRSVRSSALLSLIVGVLCLVWSQYTNNDIPEQIALVFMAASFVGMTNHKLVKSYWVLVVASIMVVVLYLNLSTYFTGYGGSLGTIANISLLVSFSIFRILNTLLNTIDKNALTQ